MAQSRELTGHGNQAQAQRQALWVRDPDHRFSFWWRGAAPLGVLAAVLIYNATAFAQKTRAQVRHEVTEELSRAGLTWVVVHADGQHVRLSGASPSPQGGERAITIAKAATCQSWLGELPCARSVVAHFDETSPSTPPAELKAPQPKPAAVEPPSAVSAVPTAPPEPVEAVAAASALPTAPATVGTDGSGLPWFDLTVLRGRNTLKLKGDVATAQLRNTLEQTARTHFPSGTLDNQLAVIGGDVSPDWEPAAKHAVEVAARCEQGVITLSNATLNVDCETQTVSAKEALNSLTARALPGMTAGNVSVLALDEIKSCEEGLVKLVTRSQIRFTTNSAKLLPTSRPLLREIAHQLERCPGVVVVEGHTDAQGDRDENVTLSLNRARAVVSGLVGLGVPAARVRAEGFGPDRPLATNETATGRAQNRRIEFRVARTGIRGE